MEIYNKLIRDNIPEYIRKDGLVPLTRYLNKKEYKEELDKKLQEEVQEYLDNDEVEEIADIIEVLYAILKFKGIEYEEFKKIRKEKAENKGYFYQRLFLEKILTPEEAKEIDWLARGGFPGT